MASGCSRTVVVGSAFRRTVIVTLLLMLAPARVHEQSSLRTLTITTTEVTAPAIAATPDGRSLIFSALGHLYELQVAGGATTQLTTGPWYDFDPAISPDGTRVAFASNRDGSGSNIFVFDRTTKRITQLSREVEAARPVWSADGTRMFYASNRPRTLWDILVTPVDGSAPARQPERWGLSSDRDDQPERGADFRGFPTARSTRGSARNDQAVAGKAEENRNRSGCANGQNRGLILAP